MAKTRSYGAGSLTVKTERCDCGEGRAHSVWRLRAFTGRDPVSGRPRQVQETFHGTETAARKALADLVTRAGAGKVDRTSATVGQLLDRWLEQITAERSRSYVARTRRKVEGRLRPVLGTIRLTELGADSLDRLYATWRAEGLSPATIRNLHAILSSACHRGVKWGWLTTSPTDLASPPAARSPEMKVPAPEQLVQLVAVAEPDDPVLAAAIAMAGLTGARRGELCALRWSDVDLEAGTMRIERSLTVADRVATVGATKTHQARRVALDPVAVEVLTRHRAFIDQRSADIESPLVEDPYVLSYQAHSGTPVNPDTISHRFAALCKRLGMPFHFHELRHFSVTTLLAAGIDVRTVAERHGHAQATMTLNRYAHALPERDRAAAAVLGRALGA
jgi:integrase